MQWQHGKWVKNADGTLNLTPLAVDGRQLLSEPCNGKNAVYIRYNQSEEFEVSCAGIAIAYKGIHADCMRACRDTNKLSTPTTTSRA